MEVANEDLPEGVVSISEILERVYEGRYFRLKDEDEEPCFDLAIDDENIQRLREQNPPFGDPGY